MKKKYLSLCSALSLSLSPSHGEWRLTEQSTGIWRHFPLCHLCLFILQRIETYSSMRYWDDISRRRANLECQLVIIFMKYRHSHATNRCLSKLCEWNVVPFLFVPPVVATTTTMSSLHTCTKYWSQVVRQQRRQIQRSLYMKFKFSLSSAYKGREREREKKAFRSTRKANVSVK